MSYQYNNYQQAVSRLVLLLNLENPPYRQDWEIEQADETRIEEFCDVYEQCELLTDERHILLYLIIASLDDAMRSSETNIGWEQLENRIQSIIVSELSLHRSTVEYWAQLEVIADEKNWDYPEWVFAITPLMRRIWHSYYEK